MKICVIGCGYVGLVSATCFAECGLDVVCVDTNAAKIDLLLEGRVPFYEPSLEDLIIKNVDCNRLSFSKDLNLYIAEADAIFLAVGTPMQSDGKADLQYIYSAVEDIRTQLKGYTLIIVKSTVPIGTGDAIENKLLESVAKEKFDVVSNPEFLREGSAVSDFMAPDRILVGCENGNSDKIMKDIYASLITNNIPYITMRRRSAEMAKYAANSFLAMKVSFINEISDLCEATNANVKEVSKAIGYDKRIGNSFLNPGPGYGGSCFPKDISALINIAHEHGSELRIIEGVMASNDRRKKLLSNRIIKKIKIGNDGDVVSILGVSFKAGTDDVRESPSLSIISNLIDSGVNIKVYDPRAIENYRKIMPDVKTCKTLGEALSGADAIVILTEWDEFRNISLSGLTSKMRGRKIFDYRNIFDPEEMNKLGFEYYCLGY